jgi:predicted regulator of Ras-like GTPase activity (Roadblock/LC7/MglB family)
MGIAEQLNAMRADFPACRAATFADLSSGLVLFTSAVSRMPQERLDALSAQAQALLAGAAARAGEALLGAPVEHAVVSDAEGLVVLVRSPVEPGEAMICHCDADIDLGAFAARAARELSALGGGS